MDGRKLYVAIMERSLCPLHREIDEVAHWISERFWKDWEFAVFNLELFIDDLESKGWPKAADYARMHIKRMRAER